VNDVWVIYSTITLPLVPLRFVLPRIHSLIVITSSLRVTPSPFSAFFSPSRAQFFKGQTRAISFYNSGSFEPRTFNTATTGSPSREDVPVWTLVFSEILQSP